MAFGAYVHIPFCRHRCDYCAFATFTDRDHLMVRYVEAVRAEIRRAKERGLPHVSSVFVGGGTPTRLDPELLASIIAEIPIARRRSNAIPTTPPTRCCGSTGPRG